MNKNHKLPRDVKLLVNQALWQMSRQFVLHLFLLDLKWQHVALVIVKEKFVFEIIKLFVPHLLELLFSGKLLRLIRLSCGSLLLFFIFNFFQIVEVVIFHDFLAIASLVLSDIIFYVWNQGFFLLILLFFIFFFVKSLQFLVFNLWIDGCEAR